MKRLVSALALAGLATLILPAPSSAAASFRPVYDRGAGEFVVDGEFGGTDESADDYILMPSGFCVSPEGEVFVLERELCTIRRFDAQGNLVATFGDEGEGPGHLRFPTRMQLAPDGNLWIYELGNHRFSVFTPEGEYVTTHPIQDIVWGFGIAPSGAVYLETHEWDYEGRRGGTTIRLTRFASDLSSPAVVDSALIHDNTYITEPIRTNVPVPFHAQYMWKITPGGALVLANSGDYHLELRSPSGEVAVAAPPEVTRQKVTGEDKEHWFAGITTSNSEGGVSRGAPQHVRDNAEFPEYKPYFELLRVDHDGYILVQTFEREGDLAVCDVFDPQAKYVGRVLLPDLAEFEFAGGFAYRLDTPEDAGAKVLRMRLVPADGQ
jgi:hypothetical protein